jgi:hypothetical protein
MATLLSAPAKILKIPSIRLLTVDSMGDKYELSYNLTLVGKRLGIVAVGGVKPPSEIAI